MTYNNRNDEIFQKKRAESLYKDKNREVNAIQVIKGFGTKIEKDHENYDIK